MLRFIKKMFIELLFCCTATRLSFSRSSPSDGIKFKSLNNQSCQARVKLLVQALTTHFIIHLLSVLVSVVKVLYTNYMLNI